VGGVDGSSKPALDWRINQWEAIHHVDENHREINQPMEAINQSRNQ
jgi:hypothetical protein